MKYFPSVIFLLLLIGCSKNSADSGGKSPVELRGKERLDYLYQHGQYLSSLERGMSKDQVRAILGSPDNTDDEYVWLYIDSMQKDSPDHTWENLEDSKSSYGFYLIFYNDKFVLDNGFPAKVAEDKPNVTMYHATSLSQDQVDKLLADARAKHPPAAAIN